MLVESSIVVPQDIEKVWEFCQDVPQVAACLPGADLAEEVSHDVYTGDVTIKMGPVDMRFSGMATVTDREHETKTIVIDAAGADQKGRGQANLGLKLRLFPEADGKTRMQVTQDIQLSGAAAQYGRGMIGDVSQILMRDFATNMQARLDAYEKGVDPTGMATAGGASGLSIGLQAAWMALKRVARRFFLPYEPSRV
jgi:carbon monoxide dehydrogenase subunit G